MMVRWMVALLLFALLAGCARMEREREELLGDGYDITRNLDVEMDIRFLDDPLAGSTTAMVVTLTRQGMPITGARIEVDGSMSHAGMAPFTVEATELGEGKYQAMPAWSMAGEWIISVRATLPDGSPVGRTFIMEVPSP